MGFRFGEGTLNYNGYFNYLSVFKTNLGGVFVMYVFLQILQYWRAYYPRNGRLVLLLCQLGSTGEKISIFT